MVWACCCRSVDTRTYNATCIGCSLWLSRRRHRPAQDQLVRLVPPVLPIGLLAGLPPDLEGAPHGRPPAADDSVRRATPADPTAAAAAAATKQDEAGRSGSSRTCHLRSNHRAHHPLLEADPALDPAPAPHARAGRPVHLGRGGWLYPVAPRPHDRHRSSPALGTTACTRPVDTRTGTPPISCCPGGGGNPCQCAEIPWPLPGSSQGKPAWPCTSPSSRQSPCPTSPSTQQDQTIGLKAKLRACFRPSAGSWVGGVRFLKRPD